MHVDLYAYMCIHGPHVVENVFVFSLNIFYPVFFHSKQIGTAQHPLQNCFHHPLISRVNPFFHRLHFTTLEDLEVSHIEVSRFPYVPQPLPHSRQVSASLDRSAARLADALKLAENLSGAQE